MKNDKKIYLSGAKAGPEKLISSRKIRKALIFSEGYLPWEDKVGKQRDFDELSKSWGGKDPARQMILRTVEQSNLGLERMMCAERAVIEGVMQSHEIASKFGCRAGFTPVKSLNIPSWYFQSKDNFNKKYAAFLSKVLVQAQILYKNFSDELASRAMDASPELFYYVIGDSKEHSFLVALDSRYKKNKPTLNLMTLTEDLKEKHYYDLMWGADSERYQLIIDGIRAEQLLECIDLDKKTRYATSFQNRIIKGFYALAALDQMDRQKSQKIAGNLRHIVMEQSLEEDKNE